MWKSGLKYPLQISFIEDCIISQEMVCLVIDSEKDRIFGEDNNK